MKSNQKTRNRVLRRLYGETRYRMARTLNTEDHVLGDLVDEGLAESRRVPIYNKNNTRVLATDLVYRITERGRAKVENWLAEEETARDRAAATGSELDLAMRPL